MAKSDIISRLRLDSGEFDSKIKRAGQELLAYSEHCKKVSLQMGFANKDAVDFAKALGSMQTTSQTARGKINELSEALVNAKVMFKNMTDAEKNSEFGRNLATSLEQLKGRLQSAKKDLADVQQELSGSKFGQFGSILDGIGQKMGLNANITELLTSKTALMSAGIGAAGAIVGKATQEWAKYNAELAKQDQITTVTTGLKGADSDRMTNQARALTDTYNVDFREAINAANTLMTQFGQTGDQAMSLIRDGMQGMIQGDGPKLLSMIQQYAPAFRDAGVTASQLVAVIQNSEGGIFTDQNMNAIVMGIKNIRLMTKATSDALAQLGIDGQKMSQQLRDGSLTIFDALKQVATRIQGVNSNSQAAGEVMQQVFGRQGAMAGTKLGEAIATLNTNLEETKRQTGEVGDAYNDLYNANVKLNGAIRDCFEYDGWEQMATGIKSSLVSALASVIEKLATIKQFLTGMSVNDYLKQMGGSDKVNRMIGRLGNGQGNARNTYDRQVGAFEAYINPRKKYLENLDAWRRGNRSDDVKAEVEWGRNKFGIDDRAIRNSVRAAESQLEEYQKKAEHVFSNVNKKSGEINIERLMANEIASRNKRPIVTTTTPRRTGRTTRTPKVETPLPVGSVADLSKELTELRKKQELATSTEKWDEYQAKIDSVTSRMKVLKGEIPDPSKIQKGKGVSVLGIGIGESALKDVQQQIDKITGSEGGVKIPAKLDLKVGGGIGNIADTGEETADSWKRAANAIQSVGSAMQSIEDPSAKIAGIVAQAIATVAMAYAQALSTDWSSKSSIWTFIAAAAASTASMIGTIASIHSATGYARGGIVDGRGGGFVPGTQTSGDNVNARLDAGELVLNRSQQSTLADKLQGNPLGDLHLTTELKGSNILVSLERTLKSTGKGQLVTFK